MNGQLDVQSSQNQPPDPLALLVVLIGQVLARGETRTPPEEVEGLAPKQAAKFLGISESQLHDLRNRGLMPEFPTMGDGRCVRISKREVRAWLLAGCPSKVRWEAVRESWLRKVA